MEWTCQYLQKGSLQTMKAKINLDQGKSGSFPRLLQRQSISCFGGEFACQKVQVHSIVESCAFNDLLPLGSRYHRSGLVVSDMARNRLSARLRACSTSCLMVTSAFFVLLVLCLTDPLVPLIAPIEPDHPPPDLSRGTLFRSPAHNGQVAASQVR